MRTVIYIEENKKAENPIVLKTEIGKFGHSTATKKARYFEKIVYLGSCDEDGDMFACYENKYIRIYKGELNDGIY